ncbi:hypothetical protein FHS21_006072 [Phyllobacterium trifolii]|uniref:Uncharacterized protein n=1 Tax=Phyllobacterium trifolii TaxID=300193 RepID=A0A839UER0_9HYPH|nr:hypothetical protein [Phyllobacterium trifolii]
MRERRLNLPSTTDNVFEQYRPQVKVTVPVEPLVEEMRKQIEQEV